MTPVWPGRHTGTLIAKQRKAGTIKTRQVGGAIIKSGRSQAVWAHRVLRKLTSNLQITFKVKGNRR